MEYTVKKLAELSGTTPRALRFYDGKGLLHPARVTAAGYRVYGEAQVDRLQQILFYRELGVELDTIKELLDREDYDPAAVLREHLAVLKERRERLETLIATVEKTISAKEGGLEMSDEEKFAGLKKRLVDENEEKYGREIREKYGDKAVDDSNGKLMGMTQEQYARLNELNALIGEKLEHAVREHLSPDSPEAAEIVRLHREMLTATWPGYTREGHIGLGEMYVADARFTAYYDKNVPGCAVFLRDAIRANV